MKRKIFYILLSLLSLLASSEIKANERFLILSDSAKVSLLTNSPWTKEVYALFGHTVIRVQDPVHKIDFAFNYGVFDFSSPNFMWRFMTGETDYMVAGYETIYYLAEYESRGVGVQEQVLNLSPKEKQNTWVALLANVQPDSCFYRYNFLYDNCATRPRDIIQKQINGTIVYTATNKTQTYRDLIHECVDCQPWIRFGIDLIIGADADKTITDRQKDFLPRYLKNAYDGAIIKSIDGSEKILVSEENVLLEATDSNIVVDISPFDYPLLVGWILFFTALFISYITYKKNKLKIPAKIFDTLLFIIAGFFGYIVFFLMFFSEHPCVNPNWNIIWLQPLHFIIGCLFFVKPLTKYIYYYHFINFVALSVFLLAWVLIPQQLEIAFIPYLLTIWLRSGMNILIRKKDCKQTKVQFAK